ncbi:transcription elongation factor SPT6 [Dendrothele bispora CBS 962.96]|uniref:Transcription elongation factor Spt6 n=1 Tax=Dendrothele bispora (strain CBS 962.96) TaxID=1314807 RepID=A0A4S8LKI5_DENBC|nr:transcription elongation factor SPT6 [Dendrothele bispora CBS 962.96]THU89541.1 transcription elongation factor SPT6 [Dendrothele bispora CBS 962.96]
MTSPPPEDFNSMLQPQGDEPMRDPQEDDGEGEGDEAMPGPTDDSSEEEEDDEDEERRIREGFIVDEDEEEEEEDDEEQRRREERRKRRKKRHRRRREEEEALEEDDLDLLEENTGTSYKKSRLKRLVRRGGSESPPTASSKRRAVIESSDDDLDDEVLPAVQDIQRIWEDGGRDDDDDDADGDMDDFIEYEEGEEEDGMPMDERAREERRKERRRKEMEFRRKSRGAHPELAGIDANAWAEIHDVFGDGHEYDWALAGDDEVELEEEQAKVDKNLQDVFEPSEIREHMLTEDDNLIRAQDTPERMQLTTSSLSGSSSISTHHSLTSEDINNGGAMWVTQRLSPTKTRDYFMPDGKYQQYCAPLVMAVTFALRCMLVDEYEVPYIWTHKRDHISHFDPENPRSRHELLTLSELWRIYSLGQKYRSLVERRTALSASYEKLQVQDDYYQTDIVPMIDGVEVVADTTEWLLMKYKDKKQSNMSFQFHDDEAEVDRKHKTPSRVSAYELAKKSIVSKLADGFGIKPHEVVRNFTNNQHLHYVNDQELKPLAYADQFADPDPFRAQSPEEMLRRARMIFATELGKDPQLRDVMRKQFLRDAVISVEPTEKGVVKIDEHNIYFNFKYLLSKPVKDMLDSAQFLQILRAEQELLVNVHVSLPLESKTNFERRLYDALSSTSFSESAKAWNEERTRVVQEVLEQHLIPAAIKWTREYIREEVEDNLANHCGDVLRKRIDVAPYKAPHMQLGDTASVLAVSWGKGDPLKDAISIIFMDDGGRMREYIKIDNLGESDNRDEFIDIIRRRKPDVIVIGGFSIATAKLSQRVKEIVGGSQNSEINTPAFDIPVIYVNDELARIYHVNTRAKAEFNALPPNARYCVGLARYIQSPLSEYAALGSDITAITFDDEQHLVPKEKLLVALERALVDVTNKVGVDINRAVTDRYYQNLLPFVCGLGPRKAREMVTKIDSLGGSLVNRNQFIKNGILTTKIFLNAAGFLRILQEQDYPRSKHRVDDDQAPDPLDDTRIHPEDYELARKMATDALELDEEDIHDEHPSHVVSLIMQDHDNDRKLSELNLDEFAVSLYNVNHELKRHTLNVIRDELLKPFAEQRIPFPPVDAWDVLTMLSGESRKTLEVGLIISVYIYRVRQGFASVRLDSGLEGMIQKEYLTDNQLMDAKGAPKGTTIQGVIIDVKLDLQTDQFMVELSSRQSDLAAGDTAFRQVKRDQYWDFLRHEKDQEIIARKKRAEVDRTRRVIKHPNFHNFNATQAEAYLDKQQRGDVVIRPSSKGFDHLAVTWKVDDKLYQHIDVTEIGADPTGQSVGGQLIVDSSHTYADLDELIVNHVQAMARRVEELMAHDRFKAGSEDELHLFLKNQLAANPAKSMYGFTLNRKRPGHFNLCFLANKQAAVQTWPVRVTPEAYYLFDAAAVGVPELCDAFKVRHLHESQNFANAAAGGKTPFAGGRTPARPGHATPGRASVRQPIGRTPNPYGGGTPAPGPHYGATPSNYSGQTPYGYQTPSHRFPGPPPPSMSGQTPMMQPTGNSSWPSQRSGW